MSTLNVSKHTVAAKLIHWLMAALIISMVFYGRAMDALEGAELAESLSYHVLGGFLVLALLVLRVSWRLSYPPPPLPESMSNRQRIAAHTVHISLYVLMFLTPVTGLVAGVAHELPVIIPGNFDIQAAFLFFGRDRFDLKYSIHAQTIYLLLALVISHIGAAVMHQLWLKDGIIRRVLTHKQEEL